MVKLLFYCFFVFLFSPSNAQAKDLLVAGTEWCPYNCVDKNRPGIISEYVKLIAKRIGMKAIIELLPWSRAIIDVKSEKYNVLMSAGESDSKGLIKSMKLLDYQMCFFTLHSSNWNYKGVKSLNLIRLGIIQDYAYGEPLDSYLAKKRTNTIILTGQKPHKRLSSMLDISRIDTFVADRILINYIVGNKYRKAGCLKSSPLYLAFNKKYNREIINKTNSEISKTGEELEKLVKKYIAFNK
ncbi:MAG: transporter substrate-binding domain-containing protein [Deltaproteobacteria bacterium]|jgi:polar amino acid transport system substrate-binding protein|nr:transporter substrate-binding domain-containing protein [Deltaproteobacteria bacterium]